MKNMDTFSVRIDQLQPSQTFISQARLSNISRHVQFLSRPVPVRLIDGRLCVVEGHERCFALYSLGEKNVSVFIDDREKPSEEIFKRMVKFTEDSGVASIQDFEERILQPVDFRALWLEKKKEFFDEKASIA